ncbi:ABC transporter substrate-binding protein [Mesorhizobium sp. B4-1-4]|uniref:ABC transporter substrate-binding protein n=1 Tax=Mesorhizobium sp. B4-1-4 TaxID=2589888 RepID=UPI00112B90CE|nr:ABC transporter substrate-binding protein [Mesorhizobium sp. B4-1-4]UCI31894.1 ABC transporter substrate-binding protein [Mesorhizobium sp. B4-1-4]
MSITINRRRLIQAGTSVLALGAIASATRDAYAQTKELTVLINGGDLGKANIETHVKPFEAETGIKVNAITDQIDFAKLELMETTNSVSIDVACAGPSTILSGVKKGYLEKIDYSLFKREDHDAIVGFAKEDYAVGMYVFAYNMAYSSEKFPDSPPKTWADFWNVEKFPGVRALQTGQTGEEGPWEEALLADGVSPDAIYPMDFDRIFKSLDKIKPHIRKWWGTGSEVQQLMQEKAVDLTNTYDGRATLLIDRGAPIILNRNQQKVSWESWVIPKGAPNLANAHKFIAFATRSDRQAALAKLIPYGPTNQNAFKLLPAEFGKKLASHPDYASTSIPIQSKWYSEIGSDGLSNIDRLAQRWNEWVLQ